MSTSPAYLVFHARPNREPVETRFSDSTLLTARKAALTLAELLFSRHDESEDSEQIEVWLIEQEDSESNYIRIARTLHRYEAPGRLVFGVDAYPVELLAMEQKRCLLRLQELYKEADYYRTNAHAMGFGTFGLEIRDQNERIYNLPGSIGEVLFDALGYVYATVAGFNTYIDDQRGHELFITCSTTFYQHDFDSLPFGPLPSSLD